MANNIFISEVLCYLQNYFGKVPRTVLSTNICGFYDETEIGDAKSLLFTSVSKMNLQFDDVPRYKQRKAGDNKRKLDVDDIMTMKEYIDLKKVTLPDFVAKNIRRLPSVSPSDVDSYALAESVSDVKAKLAQVQSVLKTLSENQASLADTVSTIANAATSSKQPTGQNYSAVRADQPSEVLGDSYVDLFANKDEQAQWFLPKTRRRDNRSIRRIIGGNNSTDLKVKAVTGSKEWHIFAGRLDPQTTTDDVTELLASKNISVVRCKMLKKTEDWHHKYAAFRVVVDVVDKDNVFDDCAWPVGADVRDWWFSSRQ